MLPAILLGEPLCALNLFSGFEAALSQGSDPVDRICSFRDEAGLGAPSDDELSGATTAGHAMNDHGFFGGVMAVHERKEVVDLFVGGHSIVGDMDEVIVELVGDVFAVVELADIDDCFDALFVENIEDIGVRPPGGGDDILQDPSERFGPFRLSSFRPIRRSNRHGLVMAVW